MNKNELIYSSVLIFSVFISSVSQVILKKSAGIKYSSIIKEYLNPRVIGAYFIFFIATFLTIYAYKVVPLSLGPILESTGYLFITVLGMIFLGEKLNYKRGISLAVIIAGIVICAI